MLGIEVNQNGVGVPVPKKKDTLQGGVLRSFNYFFCAS